MSGSYTEIFGGSPLKTSEVSYLRLDLSADVQLSWAIEQRLGGNVVADIIDLNASAPGLNVDMPDARQSSKGPVTLFNNLGAQTVTIRDATGGTIISLASGEAWYVYLADNTSEAGTWRTTQFGATVGSPSAAALAGAGLKAISSTLNQRMVSRSTSNSPVTITDGDRAVVVIWTGGSGTVNLPSPGSVGSDWFFGFRNSGTGSATVTPPSGQIDGGSTLVVAPGESTLIITDGTDFFTIGYGQSTSSVFDFLEINISGTGDYTLAGNELNRVSYRFVGTLTGNRKIVVPETIQQYWVDNQTEGAFTLTIGTGEQETGVDIPQGDRKILYCDGENVVGAESSTVTFPIAVSQGGTGATSAETARVNLGVPPTSREIIAGDALSGGGDLSQNRTISLDHLGFEDLSDPGADRVPFYDQSGGGFAWLTPEGGIQISGTTLQLDASSPLNVDHSTISIQAGSGLSGGGTLDQSRSLAVDGTVVRTSGNQTIGGTKTFSTVPRVTSSGAVFYNVNPSSTSGRVTLSLQAPSGTPNSGDLWFRYE